MTTLSVDALESGLEMQSVASQGPMPLASTIGTWNGMVGVRLPTLGNVATRVVALQDGRMLVAFAENNYVYFQVYHADGTPDGVHYNVMSTAEGTIDSLDIAVLADGRIALAGDVSWGVSPAPMQGVPKPSTVWALTLNLDGSGKQQIEPPLGWLSTSIRSYTMRGAQIEAHKDGGFTWSWSYLDWRKEANGSWNVKDRGVYSSFVEPGDASPEAVLVGSTGPITASSANDNFTLPSLTELTGLAGEEKWYVAGTLKTVSDATGDKYRAFYQLTTDKGGFLSIQSPALASAPSPVGVASWGSSRDSIWIGAHAGVTGVLSVDVYRYDTHLRTVSIPALSGSVYDLIVKALPGSDHAFVVSWMAVQGVNAKYYMAIYDIWGNQIAAPLDLGAEKPTNIDVLYDGRIAVTYYAFGKTSMTIYDPRGVVNWTDSDQAGGHEYTGGINNDTLNGADGNDKLFGAEGNDVLIGGSGADKFYGGAGTDIASYDDDSAGVTIDLYNPTKNQGIAEGDTYNSIEIIVASRGSDYVFGDENGNAVYANYGHDVVIGYGGHDFLDGQFGDDYLNGGDGNDVLIGGAGDDVLSGGLDADQFYGGTLSGDDTGQDKVSYEDVTIAGANGMGVIAYLDPARGKNEGAYAVGDTYEGIERLTGSQFNDTLGGSNGNNQLDGGLGNDRLIGYLGDDTLWGGKGLDLLIGHENNDILYGGDDKDTLYGDAGDDILDGGTGSDLMNGGIGNDTYYIDSADDILEDGIDPELGGKADVAVVSVARYVLGNGVGIEVLKAANTGFGVHLIGNDYGNRLEGNIKNDTLDGGNGAVAHTLAGGRGNDIYHIRNSNDVVTSEWDNSTNSGTANGDQDTAHLYADAFAFNGRFDRAKYNQVKAWLLSHGIETIVDHGVMPNTTGPIADGFQNVEGRSTWGEDPANPQEFGAIIIKENVGTDPIAVAKAHDEDGDAPTYILANDYGGLFTINDKTGEISLTKTGKSVVNGDTSYVLKVTVTDGEFTTTQEVTIRIQNVNEGPTDPAVQGDVLEVPEGVVPADPVATVLSEDPEGDTLHYILEDTFGGRFEINDQGQIFLKQGVDFEATNITGFQTGTDGRKYFELKVKATDGPNASEWVPVKVYITDVNGAPSKPLVQGAVHTVNENILPVDPVATVASWDDEGNAITYQLEDTYDDLFSVDAQGRIFLMRAVDFESSVRGLTVDPLDPSKKYFLVKVKATDGTNASDYTEVKVYIDDVHGAPSTPTVQGTVLTIREGVSGTQVVATVLSEDDEKDAFVYELNNSYGNKFSISADGKISVRGPVDYDADPDLIVDGDQKYYKLEVFARETKLGGQVSSLGEVRVYVTNVDEAPSDPVLQGPVMEVPEGIIPVNPVATVLSEDQEGTVQYILENTFGDRFMISAQGQIFLRQAIDFEATNITGFQTGTDGRKYFELKVKATDGPHTTAWLPVKVYITDVHGAPSKPLVQGAVHTVNENILPVDPVATVASWDDEGNAITYQLEDTYDDLFSVDAQGRIFLKQAVDFESSVRGLTVDPLDPSKKYFLVKVKATDGTNASDYTEVKVYIDDVHGAPSKPLVQGAVVSVKEEETGDHIVATVVSTDDEGDAFVYELKNTYGGKFSISADGKITLAGPVDFDDNPDLKLDGDKKYYELEVVARETKTGGLESGVTKVRVYIDDVPDGGGNPPPTNVRLSLKFILENPAPDATVGLLRADDTETVTYRLKEGADGNGAFKISEVAPGVFELRVKDASKIDYEQYALNGGQIAFTVIASDGHTDVEKELYVTVEDVLRERPVGTDASETIKGGIGADVIRGGGGDDWLSGGIDNDTLIGDGGADKFVFDTAVSTRNVDTISGFKHSEGDKIVLSLGVALFKAGGLTAGALSEGAFVVRNGATTSVEADDRIIYDASTGFLYFDTNGNGGTSTLFAKLSKVGGAFPTLTYEDFLII